MSEITEWVDGRIEWLEEARYRSCNNEQADREFNERAETELEILYKIRSLLQRRTVTKLRARQAWADRCDADMSMRFQEFMGALKDLGIQIADEKNEGE